MISKRANGLRRFRSLLVDAFFRDETTRIYCPRDRSVRFAFSDYSVRHQILAHSLIPFLI
jgi:hypothetical protein